MFDSNRQYTQDELPSDVFNAGSGQGGNIVNYNGRAVQVFNNGNGTRKLVDQGSWESYQAQQQQQAAQNLYNQQQGSAIQTLQTGKQNLAGQYSDLLKTVTGEYQPLIDQATLQQNAQNASRGLVSNAGNGGTQLISALNPVYSAEAANSQQIQSGSISDINAYNTAISNAQSGQATTNLGIPLNFGSLAIASEIAPSTMAANYGQGNYYNNLNPTTLSEALIKANTPQMSSNGIVFAPSLAPNTKSGYYFPPTGGGAPTLSMARQFIANKNNKRPSTQTISQYVQ